MADLSFLVLRINFLKNLDNTEATWNLGSLGVKSIEFDIDFILANLSDEIMFVTEF